MKLPSISSVAKAIAEARRIYRRGNYGRVYIDYSVGRAFVEEFVSPESYVDGTDLAAVDVWLEKRTYDCAVMNLRRVKADLEYRHCEQRERQFLEKCKGHFSPISLAIEYFDLKDTFRECYGIDFSPRWELIPEIIQDAICKYWESERRT